MKRHFATALIVALAALCGGGASAQDGTALVTPNGGPYEVQPLRRVSPDAPPQPGTRPADAPRAETPPPVAERRGDDGDLERARAAARAAGEGDDDLERARAAAKATDPRIEGLQRSRDAARRSGSGKDCLSGREARDAISDKRAVSLVDAMKAAREAWDGEVIDYRLCTYDDALAYELTLLNSSGKVARVRVEAVNGKFVGVR